MLTMSLKMAILAIESSAVLCLERRYYDGAHMRSKGKLYTSVVNKMKIKITL